ncbi:hypothetical protein [Haliovirga abyssi]|uniref:hypothetical protein n=1 Tax=Haliovirga abyssi TaxID=2996794 RepID=UPI0027DE9F75|nr:hypothetical protein [Haliovirga abyssi]
MKKIIILLLFIVILVSGCMKENFVQEQAQKSKFNIVKNENNYVEFHFENSDKVIKEKYILLKDDKIIREGESCNSTLVLNDLVSGEYTIIFEEVQSNGEIYRKSPYKFNVSGNTEELLVNDIRAIKNNNNIDLSLNLKNENNMEVYLKNANFKFFDVNGNEITNKFEDNTIFFPELIEKNSEKQVDFKYLTNTNLNEIYVEVTVNGYTENERKLICLANEKRLTRVITKNSIKINTNFNKSKYILGENGILNYSIDGLESGELIITYGDKKEKIEFNKGVEYVYNFLASEDISNIKIEIEGLNLEKTAELSVINPEEISLSYNLDKEKIYEYENFNFKLNIPDYLSEDDINIKFDNSIEIISQNKFSYEIRLNKIGENNINIYYKDILIKNIKLNAEKNQKIYLENLAIENGNFDFTIYTNESYLYRLKYLEINGKEYSCEKIELLSNNMGKIDVKIPFDIEIKNKEIKIIMLYEEIETKSDIKITKTIS